jgi:hypothetical protein
MNTDENKAKEFEATRQSLLADVVPLQREIGIKTEQTESIEKSFQQGSWGGLPT